VPKLWDSTIETHRQAVHDAIQNAAWALVAERGLSGVTMSQIAGQAGIGRATLYKYYPDVESIVDAWHQRHLTEHLAHLAALRDRPGSAGERLRAVLDAYAVICQRRDEHAADLRALLHRGDRTAPAERELTDLVSGVLAEAAAAGEVRADVPATELAAYCRHALAAAADLPDQDAVRRLVAVTVDGLRPR
jgi:AcrR family transcriptional regulator